MDDKAQIISQLREEFNQWEALLAGLSEAQITAPRLVAGWAIKDVVAHLWAWQQRTVARMQAALDNAEPAFPAWPAKFDPEMVAQPHQLNDWLRETYRAKSWAQAYDDWRVNYLHLLEQVEAVPEEALLEPGRYPWLGDASLALVLTASRDHHAEHRGWLLEWLP